MSRPRERTILVAPDELMRVQKYFSARELAAIAELPWSLARDLYAGEAFRPGEEEAILRAIDYAAPDRILGELKEMLEGEEKVRAGRILEWVEDLLRILASRR